LNSVGIYTVTKVKKWK